MLWQGKEAKEGITARRRPSLTYDDEEEGLE